MNLDKNVIVTLEFSDQQIFEMKISIDTKLLSIRANASWIEHDQRVNGSGTICIHGWEKILVSFGPEVELQLAELPFGIIEPLKEIYQFDFNGNNIHIGGFSYDNSGKWIDYEIVGIVKISADFQKTERE